ncbi:MAG: DUF72 domain-containing protein [Bacteroidetes bacterium SW_9_63_38]|nr:MAG: DUF72 domain-containing protein [Bacteroidetes bacterium SW_9_63_38]
MTTPSPNRPMADRRTAIDNYDLRGIHPHVRFGTASDRYAGWIGQIYPEADYADRVSSRTRTLQGQKYEERQVPIESVHTYFEHFEVLELDFTFYRPLLEDGEASSNYFVLSNYLDHAPDDASFLLKAPQKFFARSIRRKGEFIDNPDFLDVEAYIETFHKPAVELLSDRLSGLIFQQEYQRVADSPSPDANVQQLDDFFTALPNDAQMHLELRSEHLLSPNYFDWLAARGLGHVFSHWTWLPAIREQWATCGERFTAANDQVVSRLLTPRDVKYADAYAQAYPFDAPTPELSETEQAHDMVLDATALAYRADAANATLNLIANNRAWGNAPDLARTIAHRILDEEEKRQGA